MHLFGFMGYLEILSSIKHGLSMCQFCESIQDLNDIFVQIVNFYNIIFFFLCGPK